MLVIGELRGKGGIGEGPLWWLIVFALAVCGGALLIYAVRNSRDVQ